MSDLTKLLNEDKKEKLGPPDDAIWHCCECEWKGLIQDCPTEPEPVGFIEGPWFDCPVCPDCGGGVEV